MSLIITQGYGSEEDIQPISGNSQWYAIRVPIEFKLTINKLELVGKIIKVVNPEFYIKTIPIEFYSKTLIDEYYFKSLKLLNNISTI